jgi:hypothetical protein
MCHGSRTGSPENTPVFTCSGVTAFETRPDRVAIWKIGCL